MTPRWREGGPQVKFCLGHQMLVAALPAAVFRDSSVHVQLHSPWDDGISPLSPHVWLCPSPTCWCPPPFCPSCYRCTTVVTYFNPAIVTFALDLWTLKIGNSLMFLKWNNLKLTTTENSKHEWKVSLIIIFINNGNNNLQYFHANNPILFGLFDLKISCRRE